MRGLCEKSSLGLFYQPFRYKLLTWCCAEPSASMKLFLKRHHVAVGLNVSLQISLSTLGQMNPKAVDVWTISRSEIGSTVFFLVSQQMNPILSVKPLWDPCILTTFQHNQPTTGFHHCLLLFNILGKTFICFFCQDLDEKIDSTLSALQPVASLLSLDQKHGHTANKSLTKGIAKYAYQHI